jgi:WD40-like Beta Propeller Repeat
MTVMRWMLRLAVAVAGVLAVSAGTASADIIVFSGTTPTSQIDQLFRISSTGSGLRQLTTGVHPADAPAFSPNGMRIAFQRTGVGIFTMSPDGSGLRRLTSNPRDSYPTWSPDGKSIAFVRPAGLRWRVFVVPSSGGRQRLLSKAPPAGRPSWTQAGLLIPSGGDLLKISPSSGRVLKYYGANIDAIWGQNTVELSPSQSMLAYVGTRAPEPGDKECGEGPCQRFGLFIESLLTKAKKPHMIVKDTGPAAFAPDGKKVVFAASGKLEIRPVATGVAKVIATGTVYPTNAAPPAWR